MNGKAGDIGRGRMANKPPDSTRGLEGVEGRNAFSRGLACLVDAVSVSGALTDMHLTLLQKDHADRRANTDAPALADSMAYALERVFKVGP